jgi:hypothetical protein
MVYRRLDDKCPAHTCEQLVRISIEYQNSLLEFYAEFSQSVSPNDWPSSKYAEQLAAFV